MAPIVLTFQALVAGRGGEALTRPLDLGLQAGEALAVTGPNGAGKSTLLRTLAGFLPPLAGATRLENALAPDGEPAERPHEIAHYLGHRNALRGGALVRDELDFWARHMGGETASVEPALDALGLAGLESLPVRHLSAGQQRRAALARLLVAPRALWLLDEPTAALDAASLARFARAAEAHLRGGGLIVAATHQPLGFETATLELAPWEEGA